MVGYSAFRVLAGLVSLGVVVALSLWLVNRLFPGVAEPPRNAQPEQAEPTAPRPAPAQADPPHAAEATTSPHGPAENRADDR